MNHCPCSEAFWLSERSMPAVREGARPERGEANSSGRFAIGLWSALIQRLRKLTFRRKKWSAAGNLCQIANTLPGGKDLYPGLRTWWGHEGHRLRAIKQRGKAAIEGLGATPPQRQRRAAAAPEQALSDEEPEGEPTASSSGSGRQSIQVVVNLIIGDNNAISTGNDGSSAPSGS